MTSSIDLGRHDIVREVQGPKTYEVKSGRRFLHGLEDGEIRYMPERHTIMVNEATGQIMIDGGYGTFAYCWPSYGRGEGRSLHGFLHGLSFDYFMNKAATQPYMVADIPATYEQLRREVLTERRKGWIEKDHAKRLWDAIEDALSPSMSETEFVRAMWDDKDLYDHCCDGGPSLKMVEHQGMRNFWDQVWTPFREQVLSTWAEADRVNREAKTLAA